MKLPRKLYVLILVLLPLVTSGIMGVGLTRWVAAKLDAKSIGQDLRKETNRVAVLRGKQDMESEEAKIPKLLDHPGVTEFLSKVEVAIGASGVTCDEINVPKGQEAGQQLYEISGNGDVGQIARFFALLESDSRLPILEEVRVYSSKEGKTRFEIDLILYHRIGAKQR